MSDVFDLDALVPQKVTVHFGGEDIEIQPPKTGDVLRLGVLGQRLQKVEDLGTEELEKLIDELTAQVEKCVPELTGKNLNTAQLLKIVQIIGEMAIPPDAKELKARGVTPDTDPKAP